MEIKIELNILFCKSIIFCFISYNLFNFYNV